MEKKSLPALVADLSQVISSIIENGGELSAELEAAFQASTKDLKTKTDSYAFLMDKLEHESEFWKQKAESFSKVSKSCRALREKLNESIKGAMLVLDYQEIEGDDFRFRLSRTQPKLIIDDSKLPAEYKMQVVEYVPDKEKIKQDLELGVSIPGVSQDVVYALRKFVNSRRK